jgi:hypothetical protein
VGPSERSKIISMLNSAFAKLIPACTGKITRGQVAASKILFATLPEIALPVDNIQWKSLFKTDDYGEIIRNMIEEIMAWEKSTGSQFDSCDSYRKATLPSVYNVLAMKARPASDNTPRRAKTSEAVKSEALINLLSKKGIISMQEYLEEIKRVEASK